MQGCIEAGIQIGAADAFIAFAEALFFTLDVDVFRQRDVEEEERCALSELPAEAVARAAVPFDLRVFNVRIWVLTLQRDAAVRVDHV